NEVADTDGAGVANDRLPGCACADVGARHSLPLVPLCCSREGERLSPPPRGWSWTLLRNEDGERRMGSAVCRPADDSDYSAGRDGELVAGTPRHSKPTLTGWQVLPG